MGARMDLIAGEARDILLVVGLEDADLDAGRSRFDAHLSLGGGLDPTWLDLFAESARVATGSGDPVDLLDARIELEGPGAAAGDRTIERIDPSWISAVARIPDSALDAIAGRWIELVGEEIGPLPREEKPWIRDLTGQIVSFCRRADRSADVLFVWSLR